MVAMMTSFNPKATLWRHFCSSSLSMLEPPTSREVHLWCLFPNEANESSILQQYKGVLSCEERNHMLQVKNEKLQQEYLLTRVLARTLLARYIGGLVDPSSLKFVRSRSGKPQVLWPTYYEVGKTRCPPSLSFNLSHTQSLITCAISGAPQEAYLKAFGKGIHGTSLRDVAFHFKPLSAIRKFPKKLGIGVHEKCYFMELECQNSLQPYPGYCQLLLLQPTLAHFASICLQGLETFEEGTKPVEDLQVQVMKTLPLVKDEPLLEASALGVSDVCP